MISTNSIIDYFKNFEHFQKSANTADFFSETDSTADSKNYINYCQHLMETIEFDKKNNNNNSHKPLENLKSLTNSTPSVNLSILNNMENYLNNLNIMNEQQLTIEKENQLLSTSSCSSSVSNVDDSSSLSNYDFNMSEKIESVIDNDYSNKSNGHLKCLVCGDFATGYHYNCISCNGCKTFFRRTIVSGRKFICRNNGTCISDKNHRCACRACRFQQCLIVGMNSQAIQYIPSANLTLSIARKRFQKIIQQENCKSYQNNIEKISIIKNMNEKLPKIILSDTQSEILKHIGIVLRLEEKSERLRKSNFFPYDNQTRLTDMLKKSTSFADADKYSIVEKWPPRPTTSNLNHLEFKKLGIKLWFYLDLYLAIDYLKTFDVFFLLTEYEQIGLIRSVIVPSALLSSGYYSYSMHAENGTIYPDGSRPLHSKENSLTELDKKIRRGLVQQISDLKPDRIQYSLLRAINSLNDSCDELSEYAKEQLAKNRKKYTNYLLHYLQNKYGLNLGAKKFADSMFIISLLYKQANFHYTFYSYKLYVLNDCDPSPLFNDCMKNH